MSLPIVVVGSLNADFVVNVESFPRPGETVAGTQFAIFPGGKGANQAYAVGRLGGQVSMVGQVGEDAQGGWLKQSLAAAGVDISCVQTDPTAATGVALISIDRSGQNQITIAAGANGTFDVDTLGRCAGAVRRGSLVMLQLEVPLDTVVAAAQLAKESGALVILDPAPARELSDDLLGLVDYLTPNETELAILARAAPGELDAAAAARLARGLQTRGAKRVIVKLGARGALLIGPGQEHFWPALPVTAVDTTAAGDAFNAAFATALSWGHTEFEAGAYATAAAACSVTRRGAQPSMPTRAEVEDILRRGASGGGPFG